MNKNERSLRGHEKKCAHRFVVFVIFYWTALLFGHLCVLITFRRGILFNIAISLLSTFSYFFNLAFTANICGLEIHKCALNPYASKTYREAYDAILFDSVCSSLFQANCDKTQTLIEFLHLAIISNTFANAPRKSVLTVLNSFRCI